MRKLVTIRKIEKLIPIKDADFIEVADIDGWQCIVKKGEFKEGGVGVYFEIDSFLPEIEQFEFLRSGHCFKKMEHNGEVIGGFRLRTIKLRGELSQGLLLPLDKFPGIDFSDAEKCYAEDLNVIKYEPPISPNLIGLIEGQFPTNIIPKTHQDRIQNISRKVEGEYKGEEVNIYEKMDGMSETIYKCVDYIVNDETEEYTSDVKVGVCSRNLDLTESDDNALWQMAHKLKIIEHLKIEIVPNIAIQGELCGPGINKNRYGFTENHFFVFDVWDIDNQKYYTSKEVDEVCKFFELERVPFLGSMSLTNSTKELIKDADSLSVKGKTIREGIVIVEKDRKFSFKVISNAYLLEKGE